MLALLPAVTVAQWATIPHTSQSQWVCPGINSEIVTYPDGSSIIIGIGTGFEIWMQKLNADGYTQWPTWIEAFSSSPLGMRYFVPDDDGGIYAVIANKAQRVDKNGRVCWQAGGITLAPGGDMARVITDGQHGFITMYTEQDSIKRLFLVRYDSSGTLLWKWQMDTSALNAPLTGMIIGRLKDVLSVNTSKSDYYLVDLWGAYQKIDPEFMRSIAFCTVGDTVGFSVLRLSTRIDSSGWQISDWRIVKYDSQWQREWVVFFTNRFDPGSHFGIISGIFHADGVGGVYLIDSFQDDQKNGFTRIKRISKDGYTTGDKGYLITGLACRYVYAHQGRVILVSDDTEVQAIDQKGNLLWKDSLYMVNDYQNQSSLRVQSDQQGGVIASFWTVIGGIKVQHSGRVGKIGVLTGAEPHRTETPVRFALRQNYPNPFNPVTTIAYSVPNDGAVTLTVFDLLGREVSVLFSGYARAGHHTASFDASHLSSGVYLYRLTNGSFSAARKMVLQR